MSPASLWTRERGLTTEPEENTLLNKVVVCYFWAKMYFRCFKTF